jgi:deoxycytidylate deaminase
MSTVLEFDFPDAELVMGFVSPVGTDNGSVQVALENGLKRFGYKLKPIRISDYLTKFTLPFTLPDEPEYDRIRTRMDAGNAVCKKAERNDFLALLAISEIHKGRDHEEDTNSRKPYPKRVHLLSTLKRPEEVISLRRVYGPGFLLIGLFATEQERRNYLTTDKNISSSNAVKLIDRDTGEENAFGQNTRETFYLADVFLRLKGDTYKKQLWRFLDLLFGDPLQTPTPDEYAMSLAYTASLRSGDLSRQVGAVVVSNSGEIIGLGCNEVPKSGGGSYWPGKGDERDLARGFDPNHRKRDEIIVNVMKHLYRDAEDTDLLSTGKELLKNSPIFDITEYGRPVHAEMDAILACTRAGTSPRGGTLYCTTFPCHSCTKHIINVGIERVVYIEPYPKSRAEDLHSDAIFLAEHSEEERTTKAGTAKVSFEPFFGIGPRRYGDLFAMVLNSGKQMPRKDKADGKVKSWERLNAMLRVPMLPNSYLQREHFAIGKLDDLRSKFDEGEIADAYHTEQNNRSE